MDADPACAKKHSKPVPSEALVLGSGNTMANIMVWVSKGLPAGKTWPAPKYSRGSRSERCQDQPHVMGIMVGQTYRILNSDGILHNVHALPTINKQFNRAMPATLRRRRPRSTRPRPSSTSSATCTRGTSATSARSPILSSLCTSTDGKYTIRASTLARYEITAWHEKLGTQTASVTVGATDTKAQNFKFAVPAK